ncbi:hypothetical protein V6W11_19880 [Micromonospora profundi]|uniref:hypothetical protein n=1 Tax=Micromonospora profundi TaxID=1420889 RepID=UPI002FF33AFC
MSTAAAGSDADAVADAALVGVAGSDTDGLDSASCPHPAAAMARTAKTATDLLMFFTLIPIKDDSDSISTAAIATIHLANRTKCWCGNRTDATDGRQQVKRLAKLRLFGVARLVPRFTVDAG